MNELAILSLLVTLIFTEVTQLVPGGIVVPFYFALYLEEPVKILATLLSALIAVGAVKLIGNFTILYGRRKFALYIIIGLLEKALFTYLYFGNSYMFYNLSMTIGYLVPGILGGQMEKQGCVKTLCALAVVVLIIKMVQMILT
ncbi:poly-gamma-glutamate biosynthesis protein PgsC [Pseudoflavonifractor sp. HCP28S3_F10]|uniref:poly-gamma-glutamate biosynthesis protein PgsC n=1 Tax=Pseudoflavonifractor sp. HCP28S3_F10 TaxID=3438947 RepID=UPI002A902953|nr:poly-gamma-glutamate biosynthesis protein PgsC [Clostridiales bacterium]MDY4181248.1 poly-gamma-glutamate biosynthesis protein PgsC [Pseudoflavonifractor sp.]